MKDYIIQLEVHAAADIDEASRDYLDRFVERQDGFATTTPSELRRNVWVYSFENPVGLNLEALFQQMVEALPPVNDLLQHPSVDAIVVSIGVMSDLMATSVDLAPATLRLFDEKLEGVGLQLVFYATDFDQPV